MNCGCLDIRARYIQASGGTLGIQAADAGPGRQETGHSPSGEAERSVDLPANRRCWVPLEPARGTAAGSWLLVDMASAGYTAGRAGNTISRGQRRSSASGRPGLPCCYRDTALGVAASPHGGADGRPAEERRRGQPARRRAPAHAHSRSGAPSRASQRSRAAPVDFGKSPQNVAMARGTGTDTRGSGHGHVPVPASAFGGLHAKKRSSRERRPAKLRSMLSEEPKERASARRLRWQTPCGLLGEFRHGFSTFAMSDGMHGLALILWREGNGDYTFD